MQFRNQIINFFYCSFLFFIFGCVPPYSASRTTVSESIKKNTGYNISSAAKPGSANLPPEVIKEDGLSEEEAVSIALWNNAQFQADLSGVLISQADVVDASVIANPLLRYLAPAGVINVSGYINFAFDFLFQRPKRINSAQTELLKVSETMVQKGFLLIRDVQNAYADLLLANQRATIFAENAGITAELAQLANSRLRNGDISELEVSTFRSDSATAVDELFKAAVDTLLKKNALNVLMGFSPDTSIMLQPTQFSDSIRIRQPDYLQLAYNYQPELKAAQLNIEAIGKRLGWERSRILAFTATLNYEYVVARGGSKWIPNAFNPGIQLEIPVFNRNQGRIGRMSAEMEQAAFQFVAVQQRIALDVTNTFDRYEQSRKSYHVWSTDVLPSLSEAVRLSQLSYQQGDISYLPVLVAMRQLINGKLRQAEIEVELRRSVSGLNYFIGNK